MNSIIYQNEIIKRKFFKHLKNFEGFSDKSVDCYEKAILLWEDFSSNADFMHLNQTTAENFKNWLKSKKKANSQAITISYCYTILRYLRTFFKWLSEQPGYKKISRTAIGYLRLARDENRMATQPRHIEVPELETIKTVIESIKGDSEIDKRDKALMSFIFLTGARASAVRTLPMQSFDRDKMIIDQNPKLGVKTKFTKRIPSTFITFSYKEPQTYFLEWFDYLKNQKKFKPSDPIFPATRIESGGEILGYRNTGEVEPVFWKSSSSIRNIFKERFAQAGAKYYHPHTLRHLLVKEAIKHHLTEEQKKAISQNFGHEDVRTTFGSYGYGEIPEDRQIEVIKNINEQKKEGDRFLGDGDIDLVVEKLSEKLKNKS